MEKGPNAIRLNHSITTVEYLVKVIFIRFDSDLDNGLYYC